MEQEKSTLSSSAFLDKSEKYFISSLVESFLEYAQYELNFSPKTIGKYRDSIKSFMKDMAKDEMKDKFFEVI